MNYIDPVSGAIETIDTVRQQFPYLSLPDGVDFPDLGKRLINPTASPDPLPNHYIIPDTPTETGGKYYEVWQQVYAEPPVQIVSRAQGKTALINAGLWTGVLDHLNTITDPTEKALAEVALHDTTDWKRNSPFLTSVAAAIGLTESDLDALFAAASLIEL